MLAIVALVTIFLGLVGLLAVIGECQKRRRRRSSPVPGGDGGIDSLEQVKRWLDGHQHSIPTTQQIVDLLSDSLNKFSSQEWREMTLTALNDEDLSGLELSKIISIDDNSIEFLCKLQDLPGVGVACVGEEGEKIVCDVKVEWLYAMLKVVLAVDSDRLVVSISHNEPVKMSLSCSTRNSMEDGERIASSVADDIHMWFTTLTIDNAAFYSPIPAVLVSYHDDVINDGTGLVTTSTLVDNLPPEVVSDHSAEAPPSPQTTDDQALSSSSAIPAPEETKMEGVPESSEEVFTEEMVTSHALVTEQQHEHDNVVGAVQLMAVAEEPEEEKGNDSSSPGLPTSPTWRRSPSYEQLQQIELDPQRLVHSFNRGGDPSPPHLMGATSDKRALTLSVSGSEAESIYGADERIPSTLVYEITEGPSKKIRHIVAVTTAHAVKLRRRYPHAKKLHIYNDHCFTATHIKRRVECCVCGSKISGLFGRQAYVCQDCKMMVHKHCHFKADGQCPQSQLQHMNLIYPDNTSTSSAN